MLRPVVAIPCGANECPISNMAAFFERNNAVANKTRASLCPAESVNDPDEIFKHENLYKKS